MVSRVECRPIHTHLLLPVCANHIEQDFSDVFGPAPVHAPVDTTGLTSDDPVVIDNRSSSFIDPCHSLKLDKLTICDDKEDSLAESHHEETIKQSQEPFVHEKNVDENSSKTESVVGIESFEFLKLVGEGAYAKVHQVRKKGTSELYAMKVMKKDITEDDYKAEYVKQERDILTEVDHPFIIKLRYSFQTTKKLYLVMDFINGGELFHLRFNHGLFLEEQARIYAAEIVSAVSHLHSNGIMHRDIKPENILLDKDGHVILTDFGFAKKFNENIRSNSWCGTPEFMAPEMVLRSGHDKAADWWSVGVVLYEMLTGKLPFTGNIGEYQKKIINKKIKLPSFLTSEAHSLLKGLLTKDASKRLGSGPLGGEEVKRHKWFKQINWTKLDAREIQPSFRSQV